MNASDIRAAAERMRPWQGWSTSDAGQWRDAWTLAQAYLSEHPASGPSDGEMLDWLETQDLLQVILNDDKDTVLVPPLRDAIRKAMGGGE